MPPFNTAWSFLKDADTPESEESEEHPITDMSGDWGRPRYHWTNSEQEYQDFLQHLADEPAKGEEAFLAQVRAYKERFPMSHLQAAKERQEDNRYGSPNS